MQIIQQKKRTSKWLTITQALHISTINDSTPKRLHRIYLMWIIYMMSHTQDNWNVLETSMGFRKSIYTCFGYDKLTKCLKADVKDYNMLHVEILRNKLSFGFLIFIKNIFSTCLCGTSHDWTRKEIFLNIKKQIRLASRILWHITFLDGNL